MRLNELTKHGARRMQSNMFELLSHSPCSQRKRQVQSNYQNFRILKSEFLEPPLWLPLSRAFLYIYLYFPICISRANPEDKVKQWRGNATTRVFY